MHGDELDCLEYLHIRSIMYMVNAQSYHKWRRVCTTAVNKPLQQLQVAAVCSGMDEVPPILQANHAVRCRRLSVVCDSTLKMHCCIAS